MTEAPERVWRYNGEGGQPAYAEPHSGGDDSIDTAYIRKDVSDALVAAERERCAVIAETGFYSAVPDAGAMKSVWTGHDGPTIAAAIRKGQDNDADN